MNKKNYFKTGFITLILAFVCLCSFAQTPRGTIKGTVSDATSGEPLVGTMIMIEGTTMVTMSDAEGNFTISNVAVGPCLITAQYLGYEIFRSEVTVEANKEVQVQVPLSSKQINLEDVVVIAQVNRENESVLLSGQKNALVASQAVGAAEMSRKGMSNARAAVAQVSGISRQEGTRNVFVRGLGDRYNATFFNGFPVPSEDPEYKNIALEFFGSDIIQSIGVNKVFSADNNGDVAGAVIDITSKELLGRKAFSVSLDGGINSEVPGAEFLRQDGVNYLGISRTGKPTAGRFDFPDKLEPTTVKLPMNHSFGVSGGRSFELGEHKNPLSFFVVGAHSSGYSHTDEAVRNVISNGRIIQDQTGQKSTIDISQLVLANVDFKMNRRHEISYNFMLIHANEQYVGEYFGLQTEKHQDSEDYMGFLRRQQSNDNLLMTHQLTTKWSLGERFELRVGSAYNTIKGLEPDRRENYLSRLADGEYILTGSNRQKRFFSELDEDDLNAKASLRFKLTRELSFDRSNITLGYRGRFVNDNFKAVEYNMSAMPGRFSLDGLDLDALYNNDNLQEGLFRMNQGDENRYDVSKRINSAYIEATHQFAPRLGVNVGFQVDHVDMSVSHHVQHTSPGEEKIEKLYYLPSLSIRWDAADDHSLRLGVSRSYTLPQSKEISPYQYVNIGFASQGNPNLKPSDNYNVDLKWDWYLGPTELVSLGAFYKYIANPIGRVDQGNSAGLLAYDNISPKANVAGIEFEMRKNIFSKLLGNSRATRLSAGLNASYIYSNLELDIINTVKRRTELEGASPFIVNADISYNFTSDARSFTASLVANYVSDQIHTLGTQGYRDIVEEGMLSLGIVTSFKLDRHLTLKLKAGNLLNQPYRLTRLVDTGKITLDQYRLGMDFSLGLSFDL